MTIFQGNCIKCGKVTSSVSYGSKVKIHKEGHRSITCPECNLGNKNVRTLTKHKFVNENVRN